MKTYLLIFLMLSPLWACSSCQDDEDKLPGTKPAILLGKWENLTTVQDGIGWFGSFTAGYRKEIYEFTKKGASLTYLDSLINDDKYRESYVGHFADWSYDGEYIHFLEKRGNYSSRTRKPIYELKENYFTLYSESTYYYKITD
jgi:hypothetical protein